MRNIATSQQPNSQRSSDQDLLRRFIHDGDEIAFGQIVEQHAPLVMSVCRRVVGQAADADDAFQATFFALSRRPHSIYECRSLASWLYSVAWRTAVRLVRLRKRTRMQTLPERMPVTEPDPLDQISEANDLATLDEELNRLPEKYRDVLVMSYFAQQTNQQIADQLNETKGAVDGRIREARRMLRVRLTGRGVEIAALTVAASLVHSTASAASPALIQSTIQFAGFGTGLSGAESVTGVDLARMKLLTSTGTPIMSLKTGLICAAVALGLSGVVGLGQLVATQDGRGPGSQAVGEPLVVEGGDDFGSSSENSGPFGGEAIEVAAATENSPASNAEVPGGPAGTRPSTRNGKKGAVAEFSRTSARAAERQINEMMGVAKVPALNFPGENSLGDILNSIADGLSKSSDVPIRIMLDEKDPNIGSDADFLKTTQVADVDLRDLTIDTALQLIFAKVKDVDPPLTWVAQGEVILITTTETAESEEHLILRSYDISSLRALEFPESVSVPVPQTGGGGSGMFQIPDNAPRTSNTSSQSQHHYIHTAIQMGGGGALGGGSMQPPTVAQVPTSWETSLCSMIVSLAVPDGWVESGGLGTLSVAGNRLLVRQTRQGHEKVVEVLEELERAAQEMSEEL